jgi:hypothetical protein
MTAEPLSAQQAHWEKVEHLAKGYQMVSIEEFEEGDLPRKLFLVALRKSSNPAS